MADINENINFNVNFNDDEIDDSLSEFDKIDRALEKLMNTGDQLRKVDWLNLDKLKDSRAVIDTLIERTKSFRAVLDMIKKSGGETLYAPEVEMLNAGIEKMHKSMLNIRSLHPVGIFGADAQKQTTETLNTVARYKDFLKGLTEEQRKELNLEYQKARAIEGTTKEQAREMAIRTFIYKSQQKQVAEQQRINAESQREAELQRQVTAEREKSKQALTGEVGSLSNEVAKLESAYRGIGSKGNWSGLDEANAKLRELRARAEELKNKLAEAKGRGVETSGLEAELSNVEGRLSGLADTASEQIKSRLTSSFKSIFNSVSNIADKTFRTSYRTAVNLSKSWFKLLTKTFKTVMGVWKKALAGVFQLGSSGSSAVANQIKSLLGGFSLGSISDLSKEAVKLSSDLIETQNVINIVFSESKDTIDEFCLSAVDKFGLVELEAKKMAGTFGGLLNGANIVGDAQVEMSKNLVALTGDLASFNNMSSSDVYRKLMAGLTGSAVALRSLGINMTVANLEAFRLERGIEKSYEAMSQAEKTTLRYNYILSKTVHAQGDYARTFGSWANQVRLLTNNFKQLLAIIGGGIIQVLYPAVVVLNQITVSAIKASKALAKMFGFDSESLRDLFGAGGNISDLSSYTSSLENMTGSTDDATDSTNKLADATARVNDNLQTFDKLNNVKSNTTITANADVDTDILDKLGDVLDFDSYYQGVAEPEVVFNEKVQRILDVLEQFAKDIASVDYSEFSKSWSGFTDRLKVVTEDAGNGVSWLWKNILYPFYKWGMEQGSPAVIKFLSAGLEALHEIILVVAPVVDEFWNTKLAPFFSSKGEAFVDLMHRWTKSLKSWTDELRNSEDKIGFLKDTVTDLKDRLYNWIDDKGITSRLDSIGEHFRGIFSKLISPETTKQATSLLKTFTELNLIVFDNILKMIDYLLGNEKVTEFVGFLVDEFGLLADKTFDDIIEVIDYIAGSKDAREIITDIRTAIGNIVDWVVDNKETILGFVEKVTSLIEFLSEHIWAIINTLILLKGIGLIGSLLTGIGSVVNAVKAIRDVMVVLGGSARGGVGWLATRFRESARLIGADFRTMLAGVSSNISALAAPIAGVVGAVAGSVYVGSESKDYWEGRQKSIDEYNQSVEKSSEVVEQFANKENLFLSNTDSLVDYSKKIADIQEVYQGLDKDLRRLVETNGKTGGIFDFDYASPKEAQNALKDLLGAMEDAGVANDDLLERMRELANIDLSSAGFKIDDYKNQMITTMREAITSVNAEASTLGSLSEEEYARINESWGMAGSNAVQAYSNGITSSTLYVDEATGQLYNRITQGYQSITSSSQTAGLDSIVGYVSGMTAGNEILVTATGQFIDKATGTVLSTVPAEYRQSAVDAVNGMALAFNSDGSVKRASEKVVRDAVTNANNIAKSEAPSVGSNISSGISQGVDSKASTIMSKVGGICNQILSRFKSALQIHSPSQAFADLAKFIPLGIAQGITDNEEVAVSSVSDLTRGMLDGVDTNAYDLSSIVDVSKFSDKYQDILYQTEEFNKDMNSIYREMKPLEMQSSMVTSPDVKRAELVANTAQSTSTRMSEGMSALISQSKGVSSSNKLVCNLIMSGEKMASFVIDTIKGEVIQTGNF